jgi:hypothetical protein
MFTPARLCLFILEPSNGQPIAGAPFYAEVVAPEPVPEPPSKSITNLTV